MARVARNYIVSFDTDKGNCFRVHLSGRDVIFMVSTNGLYYHDTQDRVIVMTTVTENMEGFTKREVAVAGDARRGLKLVGYPSERDYTDMVRSKILKNVM